MGVDAYAVSTKRAIEFLRYLDVALVVIAMAPALVLGVPVLGYVAAACGWILQRGIAETDRRWIRRVSEPCKRARPPACSRVSCDLAPGRCIIIVVVAGGRGTGLTVAR